MAEDGKKVWDLYVETNDRVLANELARKLGFSSVYHANAVARRKLMPASDTITINTLAVGDLAFALAPYEMFDTSGMQIKEWAPYAMTFVVSMCNDYRNYLATRLAFSHGCYEVDSRRYPEGTAEEIVKNHVNMLTELK